MQNKKLNKLVEERTENLEQSLALLQATIESTSDGILVVDPKGNLLNYNSKYLTLWDIPRKEVHENNQSSLFEKMKERLEHPESFFFQIQKLEKNVKQKHNQNLFLKNKKILECDSQPYLLGGESVGRVWVFRDITERFNFEHKLEFLATHDSLTGLPNRLLLQDRISQAIISANRQKNQFALLFFDLDRFKLINDSLSHEVGDELLSAVAKRITSLMRAGDTFARLGGDEFVLLVPALNQIEHAVSVAYKVLASFQQPFKIENRDITLSTSIGIAIYPQDGEDLKNLLHHADVAMYHAKERGGDQFRFYTDELNKQSQQRYGQEVALRQALEKNEFYLLYQPQFNVAQQKLLSAEALIRWNHPEKGVVLPMDFIPAAETSGLIVPIGEWVIHEICKQHLLWQSCGLPPIKISINISIQQLRQFNFVENLKAILSHYQIDPSYIVLEITENLFLAHQEILYSIKELKSLGLRIVLDDFGSAHSSLNYLRTLQIDGIKIAPAFVKNISHCQSDEVIIKAIIAMAKNLGFEVTAQGVEFQEQTTFLQEQNCDGIQGFLYSQPITPEKAAVLFKESYITLQ